MKQEGPNVGARARVRLLRMAKERGEDFQLILLRYAHERLLYRLAAGDEASGHERVSTRKPTLLGQGKPLGILWAFNEPSKVERLNFLPHIPHWNT